MKPDAQAKVTEKAVILATNIIEANMPVFLHDVELSTSESVTGEADIKMKVIIPVSIGKTGMIKLSAEVDWERKKKRHDSSDSIFIDPNQPELEM